MMAIPRSLCIAAVAALLAGCAASPAPTTVATTIPAPPARWSTVQAPGADALDAAWWRRFGSEELVSFVQAAEVESLDVAAAVARVRQAEASARIAGANLLPQLNASLTASREGRWSGDASVQGSTFGAGLSASYEVDFWGGNRGRSDAAQASLGASLFDRDTVQLTVTAGVASAWLQAVALRERVAIAQRNLQSAQRLLALVDSRARAGAATPLELAQQRGVVASQQRMAAALQQQAGDAQTALAVLLGRTDLSIATTSLAPLQPPSVGAGLPSELLVRRPDIARAEARLAAADANVVAARAAMFPSLTLTAGVGTAGDRLRRVFENPVYSLAAGLVAPIFDAGRLAGARDLAVAQREEIVVNYRASVVAAFSDVEIALNAEAGLVAQASAQAEELAQAQRALVLAEARYRAGAETLLTLLDAQRTLYAAQEAAVQLKALRLQAAVSLWKAMGGGWRPPVAAVALSRPG